MRTGFAWWQSQKGRAWSLQVRHVLQADGSRQLARWLPWNSRLTSSFPVPASRPAAASRTASSSASQASQAQRTFCCSRVMRSRAAWYCFCSCKAKQWGWKRGVSNGCASNLLLHTHDSRSAVQGSFTDAACQRWKLKTPLLHSADAMWTCRGCPQHRTAQLSK